MIVAKRKSSMPKKKFGKAAGLTIKVSDSEDEYPPIQDYKPLDEEIIASYDRFNVEDSDSDRANRNKNPLEGLLKDEYKEPEAIELKNDLLICEYNEDFQHAEGFGYASGKQEFYLSLNRG